MPTWHCEHSFGSQTSRDITSPLSAALYVENRENIRKAVSVLWRVLMEPHARSGHQEVEVDNTVASGMRELVEAFELRKTARTVDDKPLSLKDLYQASRSSETDRDLKELRAFAATLQDGYILCKYINKVRSKQVTCPMLPPSRASRVPLWDPSDQDLHNLDQFLLACAACEIPANDLFVPEDLVRANNEGLGQVAATIIAVSKRKKTRRQSSLPVDTGPESFVPASRHVSLRHQAKRLQLTREPQQARSQDDNRPYVSQSASPPNPQPRPEQIMVTLFSTIFRDKKMYRNFLNLRGAVAQASLDALQQIIDDGRITKDIKNKLVTALLRLSTRSSLYPSCILLKGVERESFPCASGHFGDVYKGTLQARPVCIKMVKLYKNSQIDHALKAFAREAIVWSQARHPNVLPFYGVYQLDEQYRRLCLVSPWMDNGNIREYLDAKPQASRISLARDIARGLKYLHDMNIIHGDLKGPNILVTPHGQACLGDFGLSCVRDPDILQWTSVESSAHNGGTVRWKAPELIDPDKDSGASKASDMYAFACVCYEIFTGAVPFHEVVHDYTVILHIMSGKRPTRPSDTSNAFKKWGLTRHIWALMELSWSPDAEQRPTAGDALKQLPRPFLRRSRAVRVESEIPSRVRFQAPVFDEKGEMLPMLMKELKQICTNCP